MKPRSFCMITRKHIEIETIKVFLHDSDGLFIQFRWDLRQVTGNAILVWHLLRLVFIVITLIINNHANRFRTSKDSVGPPKPRDCDNCDKLLDEDTFERSEGLARRLDRVRETCLTAFDFDVFLIVTARCIHTRACAARSRDAKSVLIYKTLYKERHKKLARNIFYVCNKIIERANWMSIAKSYKRNFSNERRLVRST